ncbi:MAG TPA: hypothetical protein GYA10_09565, partial [Alphaproteobacteria bacterium]|nr:hypothetical protein [Alphaproteobacteria bacterium]
MRKWAFAVLAALIGTALSPAYAERVTLTGEVTYRERIGLPENASLRIRLVDLTAAGSPARVEAQAAIGSPGQVPLSFTLNFDDRAIDPAHRHAIIAEITSGTELWFRNTVPYAIDPLAPAAPVQVIVDLV